MSSDPIPDGDSAFDRQKAQPNLLEVLETGPRVVVGFGHKSAPDDLCLAGYRDQIRGLIETHRCTEFVFDLDAFKVIASGTLGLIASVLNEGVKVFVFNVHPDVREVLALSNLDKHIAIRDPRV